MRDTAGRKADEDSPTTWRGAAKKEKWPLIKETFSSIGSGLGGMLAGFIMGGLPGAATGAATGFAVGGTFKYLGSVVATRGQAREDAKKAEAAETASAGGAGSLGALKGILFGAATAAEDCSVRIRGMKDKVETLLAELQGVLDGSSNSQVNTAIGEMGAAATGLEKASATAGTIGDKTKGWAAAL